MPSRFRDALLAAGFLVMLGGCRSNAIEVTTSFDPVATFPSQATFTWDEGASKLPDDPRIRELNLASLIQEAADGAFAARGYRRVAASPADYRLVYEVGENRWHGPEGTTSIFSVSLRLIDAKSNRHVWFGFGRAEVQVGLAREERAQRLREALDRMLEKFPPSRQSS
jgi:hypothetical protein